MPHGQVLKIVLGKWATQVYDTLDLCQTGHKGQTHSSYTRKEEALSCAAGNRHALMAKASPEVRWYSDVGGLLGKFAVASTLQGIPQWTSLSSAFFKCTKVPFPGSSATTFNLDWGRQASGCRTGFTTSSKQQQPRAKWTKIGTLSWYPP